MVTTPQSATQTAPLTRGAKKNVHISVTPLPIPILIPSTDFQPGRSPDFIRAKPGFHTAEQYFTPAKPEFHCGLRSSPPHKEDIYEL